MTAKDRIKLVTIAQYLVDHADQISYAQIRPMVTAQFKTFGDLKGYLSHGGTFAMDCSEAVTFIYRLAGLKDPNGLHYNGAGYTGTLLSNLKHYAQVSHGKEGALLVYGAGTGTHAVMVMEPEGSNPIVFSHGGDYGPLRLSLASENTAHVGEPQTMCDVHKL